jgi:hypothetical protein
MRHPAVMLSRASSLVYGRSCRPLCSPTRRLALSEALRRPRIKRVHVFPQLLAVDLKGRLEDLQRLEILGLCCTRGLAPFDSGRCPVAAWPIHREGHLAMSADSDTGQYKRVRESLEQALIYAGDDKFKQALINSLANLTAQIEYDVAHIRNALDALRGRAGQR